jgi:uncharacterized MAPEG superfamily protein
MMTVKLTIVVTVRFLFLVQLILTVNLYDQFGATLRSLIWISGGVKLIPGFLITWIVLEGSIMR